MIEDWTAAEPTDGLPRTDRHGITWTPFRSVWWGWIGHGGDEEFPPTQVHRQWAGLSQRGPFEVKP